MEKDEAKSSQDVKTGLQIAAHKPSSAEEPGQAADNKLQEDADENFNGEKGDPSKKEHPKEIDDQMQGKKLEGKHRGGDTTDVDEFKQHQDDSV